MDDLDNKYQNDEMKNQWKNMIWHWSKMYLYLSNHLFNYSTIGESAWKQPGDDVISSETHPEFRKDRDSEGPTFYRYLPRFPPYQIRHRLEVKQKDWRSPQLVPISTLLYTARKNVKTSFWMDRHIFFWGVFCGDARTTRLWVVSVGNVKFVRLLCFSGFR